MGKQLRKKTGFDKKGGKRANRNPRDTAGDDDSDAAPDDNGGTGSIAELIRQLAAELAQCKVEPGCTGELEAIAAKLEGSLALF